MSKLCQISAKADNIPDQILLIELISEILVNSDNNGVPLYQNRFGKEMYENDSHIIKKGFMGTFGISEDKKPIFFFNNISFKIFSFY